MSARPDYFTLARAVPPAEVFQRYLPDMKRPNAQGWACGGLCPFHDDKRPGSFRVNLRTGGFICFSCGAKGGDVVDFVALYHRVPLLEAARIVAEGG